MLGDAIVVQQQNRIQPLHRFLADGQSHQQPAVHIRQRIYLADGSRTGEHDAGMLSLAGAGTSAYGINPDMALAVDVADTGDTPESNHMAVVLGGGPAIKVQDSGMVAHAGIKQLMVRRAEEAKLPYQLEVLTGGTTDAMAIQMVREGIPTGCLSIPCRYLHSPSEMVDYGDVQNSVKLLLVILGKPIEV